MLLIAGNRNADHHDTGPRHPERPSRTRAAWGGLVDAGLADALTDIPRRVATLDELAAVHSAEHVERLRSFCEAGGGAIDADTVASAGSWETALTAAGAGLGAAEALERDPGAGAFVLARPPGHHATRTTAMGFCLFNNIAVTAAALAARGERVAIVDWDVHHGNGTQDIFWDDPRVLFVSLHQSRLYPGTGHVDEIGGPDAEGATLNIPLPAGTTGDTVLRAVDELVAPAVERFAPTWVLVSAGFDGHRADPLASWMLTSGDYALLAGRVRAMAPTGRVVCFLEGGYDLEALGRSVGAVGSVLLDEQPGDAEPPSAGRVGAEEVEHMVRWRSLQPWWS